MISKSFIPFIILLVYFFFAVVNSFDPYNVLRVRRNARPAEIKKAYKDLARKWHPDKNKSPEAEQQFVEINRAYEVLNDPKRRQRYDQYGAADENDPRDHEHFDPFADIFGSHFNFHSRSNAFSKHRIDYRMYDAMLTKSFSMPYLIFVYSDWCMMCMRAEGIWERVVSQLEPLGYGIATVNSMRDGQLIDKLRINREPSIVALVDGRPISYRGNVIDVKLLIDFARDSLPADLITSLDDANYRQWMEDNWRRDNKISAIMCGLQDRPRLRFLLSAMRYRHYASFGYVQAKSLATSEFRVNYRVSTSTKNTGGLESFFLFNERIDSPIVVIQAKEIPSDNLISSLESNKFLIVPRLSSQWLFDELCPLSSSDLRHLCVILLLNGKSLPSDEIHLDTYREFVEKTEENKRTRFVYIFKDRQVKFVNVLISSGSEHDRVESGAAEGRDIAILWRTKQRMARLELLREIWSGHPDIVNRSAELLSSKISAALHNGALGKEVDLDQLVDEHGPGWRSRVLGYFTDTYAWLMHQIGKEELFPMISVAGTVIVMLLLGYCVNYIGLQHLISRDANVHKRQANTGPKGAKTKKPTNSSCFTSDSSMHLRELKASTYDEMVTRSQPGTRTVVIAVDERSKEVLLELFLNIVLPWKDERTLRFGYVVLEKNLSWLTRLLDVASAPPDTKPVAGTVLSLNGYRRYINIFHPVSTSNRGARQRFSNSTHQFLGFDSSDSSDEDESSDQPLDGLPRWLEMLFEGCCQKYSVSEWPSIN